MAREATEEDIRRIYRDTIDQLYAFTSRRCGGDRELAEDITQETWLRAVRAWRTDGVPDRPLGWLATVAARLLSNHFRRPVMDRLDADGDHAPAANMDSRSAAPDDGRHERQSLVARALARLPLRQTRLLEAYHFERRAVAEIASASGLSERAIEGRLRRARQNLRREIEAERGRDVDEGGE